MIFIKFLIFICLFVKVSTTKPKITTTGKFVNFTKVHLETDLKEECETLLQNKPFYGFFKPVMFFVLYEMFDCDAHWLVVDAIFYGIILVLILTIFFGFLLFLRCLKERKRERSPSNKLEDPEDQASQESQETMELTSTEQNEEILPDIQQNNTENELQQKRLEMMEFYRRLLMYQMFKRHKQEETFVEKIGDLLRRGIDFVFGNPQKVVDLTDPQAMFYPYWPERTDYNLLNAYAALCEHMMGNQSSSPVSQEKQKYFTHSNPAPNPFLFKPSEKDMAYQEAYLKNIFGNRSHSKTQRNIKYDS